jgi:hypothetical protein
VRAIRMFGPALEVPVPQDPQLGHREMTQVGDPRRNGR